MKVIISRNKKHLSLGRLIAKSTMQINGLVKSRMSMSAMLYQLDDLIEFYSQFQQDTSGIAPSILKKVEQEKERIIVIAKSSAMLLQALNLELEAASQNLNSYEKELDKAEKDYQASITPHPTKVLLDSVTQALMSNPGTK